MCERTVDWMVQKIFGLLASTWRIKYVGLTEFIQTVPESQWDFGMKTSVL